MSKILEGSFFDSESGLCTDVVGGGQTSSEALIGHTLGQKEEGYWQKSLFIIHNWVIRVSFAAAVTSNEGVQIP